MEPNRLLSRICGVPRHDWGSATATSAIRVQAGVTADAVFTAASLPEQGAADANSVEARRDCRSCHASSGAEVSGSRCLEGLWATVRA